jgi:N-ethylmaleimide reductase
MPTHLFSPMPLGDITLANRMVMAPLTRNRAAPDGNVSPLMVEYYRQRASAGLIITESTPVSATGVGYPMTPGLYTQAQAVSWQALTEAVHAVGGRIFIQLQHCGRISHPSLQPGEALPVAPSAIRPAGQAVTYAGMQDFVTPRALATDEIAGVVAEFAAAARLAKVAGFDGIEVHGANGYLIDQFLRDGSNQRSDAYGGSAEGRMRFLDEVLDAVCAIWGEGRVGLRLSPENSFNAMADSDPQAHFTFFAQQLARRQLAYLHILEGDMKGGAHRVDYRALRDAFGGIYIANNGYDRVRAEAALRSGAADLVAFGVPFLANPDLVRRYQDNLPLNTPDSSTFYGGGAAGYTDYPFHTGAGDDAA